MKTKITPLRLRERHRRYLEEMSEQTGWSMAEVVMQLLDGAYPRRERWPSKKGRRAPARGERWKAARAVGSAFLDADLGLE